ncbi:hypothetical protein ACVWYU_001886 [Pseudomonas sp. TE12234]
MSGLVGAPHRSESGGSGTIDAGCAGPIAGKPRSHSFRGGHTFGVCPKSPAGAGLPGRRIAANAGCQAPSLLKGLSPLL